MFQHTANELQQAAQAVLELAQQKGVTAAEVDLSESLGQSVQVRWREIEQIEYQQDQSLDITVFVGHSKGRASTADLSPQALASTVQAACDIARYTAEDPFAGIADADLMATHIADLDRYHEWDLSSENAIAIAKECEEAALSADSRISNSEGASINTSHFQFVYANSHGFCQHQRGTRHSLSCSVVASNENGMERDFWYDIACDRQDLDTPAHIGRTAAERATRRLSPQTVATGNYPILFDAAVAGSLIGHIVGGYFLDSYSARKLNQTSTGNAGGAHNLYLTATENSQTALLKQMGTGLLITELMGQGVNMLTGDYSRGAAGFWVENGIISHPVSGITIAGSLKEMLQNIIATGNDFRRNASSKIGSILISNMTVAGA